MLGFGCTAHFKRGKAIRANHPTVSENKITKALIGALSDTLSHPDVVRHFVDRAQRRIVAATKTPDDGME